VGVDGGDAFGTRSYHGLSVGRSIERSHELMKRSTREIIWLIVFTLLLVAPVLIMILAPRPEGRQLLRDVAVALGFLGLSLMGLQFLPTARLHFIAETFHLDTLYSVHHELSKAAFFLVLAHPILLILSNPYNFVTFNILGAPWKLRAGVIAFLLMLLLVMTSVWRVWLRLKYEPWRGLHDLFTVGVAGFALYHILKVDYYTALPLQRWLWIAYAVLWGVVLLEIRVIKPIRMLQKPFEIAELIEERGNTWSMVLEPVGHEGMPFKAGQVAWLTVDRSPFRIKEHPFSFASSAEHPERIAFAIRELGDFTNQVGEYPIGTPVYIDGPYGTFDLQDHPGSGFIFIAGGIGSAPIMSMLRTLAERGDDRPMHFFYGNRTWEEVTFREELAELEEKLDLEMIHVLEKPPEDWDGETGFITEEVLRRHVPVDCVECVYFICGPLPMIHLVRRGLHHIGVHENRIHSEQYEMA
jgi:predicted ferric reductase